MEEKMRSSESHVMYETELEINKMLKKMEEDGTEKKAIENAHKWLLKHPYK